MTSDTDLVTPAQIDEAAARLDDIAHRTPMDTSTTLADRTGAMRVGLKLENMQRTGSFKIRGAYNKMRQLPSAERADGVVAASAGNHAQGVALAGRVLDIEATIVVPEITPAAKIDAARGYGADVVVRGEIYERSYERALEIAESTGATFVHPFNDDAIIAGQGTVGREVCRQIPEVETILVPIGGGGLISGIAVAANAHDPSIRVIGVQPEGAGHAKPSLDRDEIHELETVDTVADGIADARLLDRTFVHLREYVDDVVVVSDADLAVAVAVLAERAKTVVEAAGAAPVAALLSGAVDVTDETVVAVVSGGNADLTTHASLVRTGLMRLDRYVVARLTVRDWPASLSTITDAVTAHGATLSGVETVASRPADGPNRRPIRLRLEGSGREHLDGLLADLDARDGLAVREHSLASA
ncbi:threonine ammonia-lyase (plasmid) [Haloferacaceae archaeon DSL9]